MIKLNKLNLLLKYFYKIFLENKINNIGFKNLGLGLSKLNKLNYL